ncbi:MAG: penicillin-binding protein 1C [Hyphomicrobiaceae bacterium]
MTYRAARSLPPLDLAAAESVSVTVLDRKGRLLRAFTSENGRWRLPVAVGEVDPRYLAMLLAYEDRRFYRHGGVDAVAVMRAAYQLVANVRVVSGSSTLTMQLARLLDGRHERSLTGKIAQMLSARALEQRLSKTDILRLYLQHAPFGGNLEGVRAASLAYFGKEPRRLSIGEAALLVALPQSPESRRPDRSAERARRARDRVLDRMVARGVITAVEAKRAKNEHVAGIRRAFPLLAPHLAEAEILRRPQRTVHRLTIDRDLQQSLEQLARDHARAQGSKLSAALLAVAHESGEILAYVGSADYLDEARLGAIDMVQAVRSPGSTLKPFVYGLAFEAGLAHPETLIEDRPVRFGTYAPRNFDDDFHGTVTIRAALAGSLNIPAVKLLDAVGPGRLVGRLRRLGTLAALPADAEPSLAIALGGIGLRMSDLATLYASLASRGDPVELRHLMAAAPRRRAPLPMVELVRRRLLSHRAAWYVTDILKDAPPPASARSGRIAYKTGTSYGYRDAWAAGFDGRHTIVAWVGRPDGSSTPGLSGRTSAAPLLFDAFARVAERRAPLPTRPRGVIVARGADLPPPLRRFERGRDAAGPFLVSPLQIAFPPDRADVEVETGADAAPVILKAEGGTLPLRWLIDGQPINSAPHRRDVEWQPTGRGFARLTVIDANGLSDRVTIRLR